MQLTNFKYRIFLVATFKSHWLIISKLLWMRFFVKWLHEMLEIQINDYMWKFDFMLVMFQLQSHAKMILWTTRIIFLKIDRACFQTTSSLIQLQKLLLSMDKLTCNCCKIMLCTVHIMIQFTVFLGKRRPSNFPSRLWEQVDLRWRG